MPTNIRTKPVPLDLGPIRARLDTYGERSIQTVPDYEYELIATRGDVRDLVTEVERLQDQLAVAEKYLNKWELRAIAFRVRVEQLESEAKLRAGG